MSDTPAVPAEAVADAARAVKARHAMMTGTVIPYDEPEFRADIETALEAAAPRIRANERAIWGAYHEDLSRVALAAERDRHAAEVERAVTAERDRIRQLATELGVFYGTEVGCVDPDCPSCVALPFADLLSESGQDADPARHPHCCLWCAFMAPRKHRTCENNQCCARVPGDDGRLIQCPALCECDHLGDGSGT